MRGFAERGGWWVVGQALLLAAVLAAVLTGGGDPGVGGRVAGASLVAAGAVQSGLGLVTLGESLTPFPAPRPGTALVERGIYRMVRHPIYGGLCLGSAGVALYDGNPIAVTIAAGLTLFLWAKAGHEEGRLVSHDPGYADYRDRVPRRLVPWVL